MPVITHEIANATEKFAAKMSLVEQFRMFDLFHAETEELQE